MTAVLERVVQESPYIAALIFLVMMQYKGLRAFLEHLTSSENRWSKAVGAVTEATHAVSTQLDKVESVLSELSKSLISMSGSLRTHAGLLADRREAEIKQWEKIGENAERISKLES